MCYTTETKEPKIADRDIPTWKVIEKKVRGNPKKLLALKRMLNMIGIPMYHLVSPCAQMPIPKDGRMTNPEYRNSHHQINCKGSIRVPEYIGSKYYVGVAFHSYVDSEMAFNMRKRMENPREPHVVVRAVIPKGTAYMTNGIETVSEELRLNLNKQYGSE